MLLPAAAGSAAPAIRPECVATGFSPAFAKDRTVFCATVDDNGTYVWKSTDRGRTWERRGRVREGGEQHHVSGFVMSPLYERDRRVYLAVDRLYGSADDGHTFTVTSDRDIARTRVDAYVDTWPNTTGIAVPGVEPHVSLLYASYSAFGQAFVIDSIFGERDSHTLRTSLLDFVLPPDFATRRTAVAVTLRPGITAAWQELQQLGVVTYRCDVDFHCTDPIQDLGVMYVDGVEPIGRPGEEYLYGHTQTGAVQVWRTTDSGYAWARWPSVERLLPKGTYSLWMTADPDRPGRLYLHTAADEKFGGPRTPRFSLFRSDDDGKTWHVLGRSYVPGTRGVPRDTLPWHTGGDSVAASTSYVSAQPGGYLYVLGGQRRNGRDVVGLWCSRDAGHTWRTAC
jgi:hypothetical protein